MKRGLCLLAPSLSALCLMTAPDGAMAQTAEIVACAKDPASQACLVIPGNTGPAPKILRPQWSAAVSGGLAPRDDGPTGTYEALSLHRQMGRSYLQLGATHYNTTLEQGGIAITSTYDVGTVGFGGNYNNWVLDTYASYGRQAFGDIRYANGTPISTGAGTGNATGGASSPYLGAGVSFGRMFALGQRFYVTPTAALAYAWSRLLRPLPSATTTSSSSTSEPTWTTAGRLRLDWMPGHNRQTYLGLSVAGLWSNNATSLIGSVGSGGVGSGGLVNQHVHDVWAEVGAHASLSVARSLRVEATAGRTLGLISGNATTVGLGLRRSF